MRMVFLCLFVFLTAEVAFAQTNSPEMAVSSKVALEGLEPVREIEFSRLNVRHRPTPSAYPSLARIGKVQGTVALRLTVGPMGFVEKAEAFDGPTELRPAAEAYGRQWAFDPVVIDGKPARVQCQWRVPFRLKDVAIGEAIPERHQVVLEVETVKLGASVPFDVERVRTEVREWLARLGLHLVEPEAAEPERAYHLNLRLQAFQTPDGLYLMQVIERCSLLADRNLLEDDPKWGARVCTSNEALGQRGEVGFQDNLLKTVRSSLGKLGISAAPGEAMVSSEWAGEAIKALTESLSPSTQGAKPVEFDFSKIKIKHQPPAPPYPPNARRQRIQGTVVVRLTIDRQGVPRTAEALEGPPELWLTAIRFALQWEFEPARINGVPQLAHFKLTMPFRLR